MITRKAGPALAAGCTMVLEAGDRRRRSRRWRWPSWPSAPACRRACFNVRHRRRQGDRRRADLEPDRAQAHLHRLDRDRQAADGAVRRHGEEGVARARRQRAVHRVRRRRSRRWRSRARSPRSTATPARPASAPTASSCRTASTTRSPQKLAEAVERAEGRPTGSSQGAVIGPLIDDEGGREGRGRTSPTPCRRAPRSSSAASATRSAAASSSRPC